MAELIHSIARIHSRRSSKASDIAPNPVRVIGIILAPNVFRAQEARMGAEIVGGTSRYKSITVKRFSATNFRVIHNKCRRG
jgi:hypothetical protein